MDHFLRIIRDAIMDDKTSLEAVANEIVKTHLRGGKVFTFGAGHAQAFAMELTSRAGGLAFYQSMHLQDIRTKIRDAFWDLRDSAPERVSENGIRLLDHHKVTVNDLVIIASQSGRNCAPIEMALECQRRNIKTVAISSKRHTDSVASRHPSGKKLFEVVTHFIDNGSVLGDAALELPDGKSICSLSTIGFTLIAQSLNLLVVRDLMIQGITPPVLVSANLDHGDKTNSQLKRETPPDVSN
jgi:uncharacterized phosphosugar-binding protein